MAELLNEIIADDNSHVTVLRWSGDGRLLANSGFDTSIKIWDRTSLSLVQRLEGHENCANALVFHPDDSHLISASSDSTVRFWDLASGEETRRFKPHSRPIVGLRVLHGDKQLITSSYDKSVRVISIEDGSEVGRIRGKGRELGHLVLLDLDSVLITGGIHPDFSLWSIPTGEPLGRIAAHNGGVAAMNLFRDGTTLMSVGFDGEVKRWTRGKGVLDWEAKTICTVSRKGYFFSALSPSQELLALCVDNGILILSTQDGTLIHELRAKPKSLYSPRFTPDGSLLAASAADRTIRIWRIS